MLHPSALSTEKSSDLGVRQTWAGIPTLLHLSCGHGTVASPLRPHLLLRKVGEQSTCLAGLLKGSLETEGENVAGEWQGRVVAHQFCSKHPHGGITVTGTPILHNCTSASKRKSSFDTCLLSHLSPRGPSGASRRSHRPWLSVFPPLALTLASANPPDYKTSPRRGPGWPPHCQSHRACSACHTWHLALLDQLATPLS